MLNDRIREELLHTARETIRAEIKSQSPAYGDFDSPEFHEKKGAFVTLHSADGSLRGCIGYIEPVDTLIASVKKMAVSAALNDPRFPPLSSKELNSVVIEITVLGPLVPISSVKEIEVGKHGLVITKGFNRGLLLPQVPVEQGWGLEDFVSHTCMKAGLRPETWRREKLTMEIFEGELFSEKDFS